MTCWHLSRRTVILDDLEHEVCSACGRVFECEEYDYGPTLRDTGETLVGFAEMTPKQRRQWFFQREVR